MKNMKAIVAAYNNMSENEKLSIKREMLQKHLNEMLKEGYALPKWEEPMSTMYSETPHLHLYKIGEPSYLYTNSTGNTVRVCNDYILHYNGDVTTSRVLEGYHF